MYIDVTNNVTFLVLIALMYISGNKNVQRHFDC